MRKIIDKTTLRIVTLLVILFGLLLSAKLFAQSIGKRTPYSISLTKMSLSFSPDTHRFEKVKVSIDGNNEYAIITRHNDMLVKNTRYGTERTQYSEPEGRQFIISNFEAEQINRATKSLIATLNGFENNLKKKRWDKCLYLDAYFPKFLKSYYYLVCAARNSPHALPRIAKIPDSAFDVSLNSPKSDARIKMWQDESDYVIKLRIITKELLFQLKNWQKKELTNKRRNMEVAYSAKAEEAYGLFVKLYFNLKPSPILPGEGEHL